MPLPLQFCSGELLSVLSYKNPSTRPLKNKQGMPRSAILLLHLHSTNTQTRIPPNHSETNPKALAGPTAATSHLPMPASPIYSSLLPPPTTTSKTVVPRPSCQQDSTPLARVLIHRAAMVIVSLSDCLICDQAQRATMPALHGEP